MSDGEAGGVVDDCLRLALVYKCSPFEFLARPAHVVEDLCRRTHRLVVEMQRED